MSEPSSPVNGHVGGSGTRLAPPGCTILDDRDWIGTVRQTIPAARRVLAGLRPTWELPGVDAIDVAFLRAAGIRALIWDVDGTITHRHATAPAVEVADAFERLLDCKDLRHAILSNCGEARFAQLARLFPTVPIVRAYATKAGELARIHHLGEERWTAPPRGRLRPLRKPDPRLVRFALGALGLADGRAAALVGDQYLTDIAAANLAGIRSIKVPTTGPASFPPSVRMLQRVDQWLYRLTV